MTEGTILTEPQEDWGYRGVARAPFDYPPAFPGWFTSLHWQGERWYTGAHWSDRIREVTGTGTMSEGDRVEAAAREADRAAIIAGWTRAAALHARTNVGGAPICRTCTEHYQAGIVLLGYGEAKDDYTVAWPCGTARALGLAAR